MNEMGAPLDLTSVQELTPNTEHTKELKKYTGIPGRLLAMLCSGCTSEEAAAAVGVDSSYVRHLKQEPDFVAQIKQQLTENLERAVAIDENYASIEKIATDRLKTLIPLVHSPRDLMQMAAFANAAKKKTNIGGSGTGEESGTQKTVKIMMPTVILNNFTTNVTNEIVAAGGRTLTTLNSASLSSLVSKAQEAEEQQKVIEQSKTALLPNVSYQMKASKHYVSPEDLDKL